VGEGSTDRANRGYSCENRVQESGVILVSRLGCSLASQPPTLIAPPPTPSSARPPTPPHSPPRTPHHSNPPSALAPPITRLCPCWTFRVHCPLYIYIKQDLASRIRPFGHMRHCLVARRRQPNALLFELHLRTPSSPCLSPWIGRGWERVEFAKPTMLLDHPRRPVPLDPPAQVLPPRRSAPPAPDGQPITANRQQLTANRSSLPLRVPANLTSPNAYLTSLELARRRIALRPERAYQSACANARSNGERRLPAHAEFDEEATTTTRGPRKTNDLHLVSKISPSRLTRVSNLGVAAPGSRLRHATISSRRLNAPISNLRQDPGLKTERSAVSPISPPTPFPPQRTTIVSRISTISRGSSPRPAPRPAPLPAP